jgi:hypothetical protein
MLVQQSKRLPHMRSVFSKRFFFLLSILTIAASALHAQKSKRDFYQITIYHFSNIEQEKILDDYVQMALMPALHRQNIAQIGVFKSLANDTSADKLLYILLPIKNLHSPMDIATKLKADDIYQQAGSAYINAVYTAPAYTRMETILLQAFSLAPKMQAPRLKGPKNERVYELRSYESATEKIYRNKVHMFNEGDEIGLFKRLQFNAIFYGYVIAGGKMPNLMYMTSFENRADRDAHWKSFSADPQWKQLSGLPEYQHNVSHIDITFLRPTEYSDL